MNSITKSSVLIALSLVFALAGAVHASPIMYVVQFSGGGGVGTGFFTFDAGSSTNTTIGPPATFVNFVVPVGGINYVAQSATDDDAKVNALGRVIAVDADLEPLAPVGLEALVLSLDLGYQVFDANNKQIASGTYQIAAVPEPSSFWLLGSGLLISGVGTLRRRLRTVRVEASRQG
jgi:PEP-CTERM motif